MEEIKYKIGADTKDAQKNVDKLNESIQDTEKTADKAGDQIEKVGKS